MKKKYVPLKITILDFAPDVICISENFGSEGYDDFGDDIWGDFIW